MTRTLLWWGRFDPDYSRNRILRSLLQRHGVALRDFRPRSSLFGALESRLLDPGPADAVWVPCFRHRDLDSARRYADRRGIPLIFDPLISSWDKAVFERRKFPASHRRARRLQARERALLGRADLVIADTEAHASFFIDQLGAPAGRTLVVPVGAEEPLFCPQPWKHPEGAPEILFFGSFIALQGPLHIASAARLVPEARWTFLGEGPLRADCEALTRDLPQVQFEDWLPYPHLPERIGAAALVLGIFGDSPKAGRVIPNKVYQALACGRAVITRTSPAYPSALGDGPGSGLFLVPPAAPEALARTVTGLLASRHELAALGHQARRTYDDWFSQRRVEEALLRVVAALGW